MMKQEEAGKVTTLIRQNFLQYPAKLFLGNINTQRTIMDQAFFSKGEICAGQS